MRVLPTALTGLVIIELAVHGDERDWPLRADKLTVSERDGAAPTLREIAAELPFRWHP